MAITYGQLYGSGRRSGAIPATSGARGVLSWSEHLAEGRRDFAPRVVLCGEERVVVEGLDAFVGFDRAGKRAWTRKKHSGAPVVFRDGQLFFCREYDPATYEGMAADGTSTMTGFPIPGLFPGVTLVLFHPLAAGLVAQVQEPSVPEDSPASMLLYRVGPQSLGFDWSRRYEGTTSTVAPMVADDLGRVITSTATTLEVFDLNGTDREATPLASFPLPLGHATRWQSVGEDGSLVACGVDEAGLQAVATDLQGQPRWRLDPAAARAVGAPVAPPLLVGARAWLLTSGTLLAVEGGQLLWRVDAGETTFRGATALGDGSVLVTSSEGVTKVDPAGTVEFVLPFEEPLLTPPVIDERGRIYVAGQEFLYALD